MLRLFDHARIVLTLLTGFVLGIHVAVVLHELGHALGIWLSGGEVAHIVMMPPLPAGYVEPATTSHSALMQWWGGVVFGALVTPVPLLLARCLAAGSLVRFVLLMIAALCLGHNAIYLVVGGIVPFGDAQAMLRLGAPRWFLFVFGSPLLIGFVMVLTATLRNVGLRREDALWKWIIVVEAGLLPLPALMVVGTLLSPTADDTLKLAMRALGGCYGACFLLAAGRAHANARAHAEEPERPLPTWSAIGTLFAWTALFIFVEWLAFRRT